MLCQLLLVNLFIATLSETCDAVSECKQEWLRQWASQILCIEQLMSKKERKEVLGKYTQIIAGKRVIMNRWKQKVIREILIISEKVFFLRFFFNLK